MSLGSTKLNVVPSRTVRVQIETRIQLANKGYSLLKAKLDGITYRFNVLEAGLKECKIKMREKCKLAYLALNKLKFLGFDFRSIFCTKPESSAHIILKSAFERVAGVTISKFMLQSDSSSAFPFAGLDRAGEQVVVVRNEFLDLLKEIVEMASRIYMLSELKDQMRSINTRCNAIEYVVLPRLTRTLIYIESELDEMEREEFFRLKRAKAARLSKKAKESDKEREQNVSDTSSSDNLNKNDVAHSTPSQENFKN